MHERISPKTIIGSVQKEAADDAQANLFDKKISFREAIDFYKHKAGWSNRFVAGDSLLVMNSLMEKEALDGKVQMIYFDPPYGIKYGSNFQPFVNKTEVKDEKGEDLSAEPETIKAFRDTWELGIHSYLAYLRDRLLLAQELLAESGSIFLQISDENVHRVRQVMDEVFGVENFCSLITFTKAARLGAKLLPRKCDYIVWYAKDKTQVKYRQLFLEKRIGANSGYTNVELADGSRRKMTKDELANPELIPKGAEPFALSNLEATSLTSSCVYDFEFNGRIIKSPQHSWKTTKEGMQELIKKGRVWGDGIRPRYVRKFSDLPAKSLDHLWDETGGAVDKIYAVQTDKKVIRRCILMTTDPGDLVFDPTCGSGTTAFVAEQWGRRWITCDTSRVALFLARNRLMTAHFDYYKLANPKDGIGSGFEYKQIPHITLKSVAHNEPPPTEILYDQPLKDTKKARVTGPFTVEACHVPSVKSVDELLQEAQDEQAPVEPADASIVRSGATANHNEWRDELYKTGVRMKGENRMHFSNIEPLSGTTSLDSIAETKEADPKKVLIVFGPEYAPLDPQIVERACKEARTFEAEMLLFCAFAFDPEAAKTIDELPSEQIGLQVLRSSMNPDLFTKDLKKAQSSSESFFLIGRPDVIIHRNNGTIEVEVLGFDYYSEKDDDVIPGEAKEIATWMLDTNYDGRSLYPSQVFFPFYKKNDWSKLASNLRAEIDQEKIEVYSGTKSLPFEPGEHKRIAIKIIDVHGTESLRIMDTES